MALLKHFLRHYFSQKPRYIILKGSVNVVILGKGIVCTLNGTVCEILGTCVSVGCTIEGQAPRDLNEKVQAGEIEIPAN